MSEKNYVINVKSKVGTIITVRADSAEELATNIGGLIANGINDHVDALEELFLGTTAPSAVDMVTKSLGATVISQTPVAPPQTFAPVPPPAATPTATPVAGVRMCNHGPMTPRKGNGAKGEWKGYFCPTPKGTPDQCAVQWVTKKDPEWNSI